MVNHEEDNEIPPPDDEDRFTSPPDNEDSWMSLREVAQYLGEDEAFVQIMIQQGKLPAPKRREVFVGGKWRWAQRWWRFSVELNASQFHLIHRD